MNDSHTYRDAMKRNELAERAGIKEKPNLVLGQTPTNDSNDRAGYVGFAYDYGAYPRIVAVHSRVPKDMVAAQERLSQSSSTQGLDYQDVLKSRKGRVEDRHPSLERLPPPGNIHLDRYQKEIFTNRPPPLERLPQSNGVRYADYQDALRCHNERLENFRFPSDIYNTRSMNGHESHQRLRHPPVMPMPFMMMHKQPTRSPLSDRGQILLQTAHHRPIYYPNMPFNVRQALLPRICSDGIFVSPALPIPQPGFQVAGPFPSNSSRHSDSPKSRKRHHDQTEHGQIIPENMSTRIPQSGLDSESLIFNGHGDPQGPMTSTTHPGHYLPVFDPIMTPPATPSEGLPPTIPPPLIFSAAAMARPIIASLDDPRNVSRYYEDRNAGTRFPCHPSCNDFVDAAVESAKRYAVDKSTIVNIRQNCDREEKAFVVAESKQASVEEISEMPTLLVGQDFFQRLLLHENRYELLQTLKASALSGRKVLLHVVNKLLSIKVIENALLLLDNLKRSDLTEVVKEKVLSVVQEIIWGHPPRYELWSDGTVDNETSFTNDNNCQTPIALKNQECIADEDKGSMAHPEPTEKCNCRTDAPDNNLVKDDSETSVQDSILQKLHSNDFEKDQSYVDSETLRDIEILAEGNPKYEAAAETESCHKQDNLDYDDRSYHCSKDEKIKSPIDNIHRKVNYNLDNNGIEIQKAKQVCEVGGSEKNELSKNRIENNTVDLTYPETREECVKVEKVTDFQVKQQDLAESDEKWKESNEKTYKEVFQQYCYSVDDLDNLENAELELLGKVSVSVDSSGNIIIQKEIKEEESLEP